jgi:molybdopterin adenylyltransferase
MRCCRPEGRLSRCHAAAGTRETSLVSVERHRAAGRREVGCALLTVSDTRTPESDGSGRRMRELLEGAGHRVWAYAIVPDDPARVRAHVEGLLRDQHELIVTSGGTGIAPRDTTYEAVASLLEKRLDGFGELFRWLSYEQIGSAAMLSRAVAGVAAQSVVAVLPGSTAAVELALERLILPELGHMVSLVRPG